MDKALQMGKSSTTGSFHLLIGVVASTAILAIGTLILAAFLTPEQYGLYGIIIIPTTMISFFRDWGVNYAITQRIASLRAAGKGSEIQRVIVSGVIFEVITGVALSLVSFGLAVPLSIILQRPDAAGYMAVMSVAIFGGALVSAATGVFVGYEKMKLNSFTQILQSLVKTVLSSFLVIIGFGVIGAVIGNITSYMVGAVIAVLIVYFSLFRPLTKTKVGKHEVWLELKQLLGYGMPLTVSSVVAGVLPQFFAFIMAIYAGDAMMGNYYAATNFAVLLTFLTFPIATSLFPVFSKLKPEEEPELVSTVFSSSVKYTALLLVPATILIMTVSTPLVFTLFGTKYPFAPLFLTLSSIINLYVVFGNISLNAFQTGLGKTKQVMKQSLLSLAVGLPLAYFLVSQLTAFGGETLGQYYAVIGGILGILISSVPGMAWAVIWTWKNYRAKADFKVSVKILAASIISALATFAVVTLLGGAPYWLMLIIGVVVFLFVYSVSAPLIGAIYQTDIDNLISMISGLGFLSKIIDHFLFYMRRISKESPNSKKYLKT